MWELGLKSWRGNTAQTFLKTKTPYYISGKYGADVFENENAVFLCPGNTRKAFLKTKVLQAISRPSAVFLLQHDNSLPAATARSFVVSAPEPTLKAT
jgi:hypothetical protein